MVSGSAVYHIARERRILVSYLDTIPQSGCTQLKYPHVQRCLSEGLENNSRAGMREAADQVTVSGVSRSFPVILPLRVQTAATLKSSPFELI